MGGWMGRWVVGWMDGWMVGWMDGWMDGDEGKKKNGWKKEWKGLREGGGGRSYSVHMICMLTGAGGQLLGPISAGGPTSCVSMIQVHIL